MKLNKSRIEFPSGTATIDLQSYINMQQMLKSFIEDNHSKAGEDRLVSAIFVSAILESQEILLGLHNGSCDTLTRCINSAFTNMDYIVEINQSGNKSYFGSGKKKIIINL